MFADDDIVATVLHEAGIAFDTESPWQFHHLEAIGRGVWALSQKLTGGLSRLRELLGPGVRMYLSPSPCGENRLACALPWIPVNGRYSVHFSSNEFGRRSVQSVVHTTVHELAHVMDWHSDMQFSRDWDQPPLTNYAACTYPGCLPVAERWAEAVTYFVFGEAYAPRASNQNQGVQQDPLNIDLQVDMVRGLLNP